jgi:selenoprotein W-related protein
VKQLKQLVRDRIDPDRDLGHIDRPHGPAAPKFGKSS